MVGTGGTVRNLAKIHMRSVAHPIARVDGYVLQRREVRDLTSRLTSRNRASLANRTGPLHRPRRLDRRRRAGGDRGDGRSRGTAPSWCPGTVSGRVSRLPSWTCRCPRCSRSGAAPSPRSRRASPPGTSAGPHAASSMTRAILGVADPTMTAEMREVLDHATTLLDVGQSINYYDRWTHAAGVDRLGRPPGLHASRGGAHRHHPGPARQGAKQPPSLRAAVHPRRHQAHRPARRHPRARGRARPPGQRRRPAHPSVSTSAATGSSSRPAFPTRGSRRT